MYVTTVKKTKTLNSKFAGIITRDIILTASSTAFDISMIQSTLTYFATSAPFFSLMTLLASVLCLTSSQRSDRYDTMISKSGFTSETEIYILPLITELSKLNSWDTNASF